MKTALDLAWWPLVCCVRLILAALVWLAWDRKQALDFWRRSA